MAWGRGTVVAAAVVAACGAASAQPRPSSGPVATYWMSAATASGFGAGMTPGQRPSMGQIMGMMGGGSNVAKTLTLQLGSSRKPSGEPQAEHLPPAALGAGQALPLLTPRAQPAVRETPPELPREMQRPRGRMLVFWGCSERARAGQPLVLDFAQMAQGRLPAGMEQMSRVFVSQENPPSPSRNATYGEWPNERTRVNVPANGSLVGEHVVRGNYAPEIRFQLGPNQDFLAPLQLTSNRRGASGAGEIGWRTVPNAKAYHAIFMGGGDNETMVMWSSSEVQAMAMLADYLSDADIARLVQSKALMGPQQTSCQVPKEALDAAPAGMLQLAAYGGEANFSYPPRPSDPKQPWNLEWTAKVRFKSTTGAMLGMDMSGLDDADDEGPAPGARPRPGQSPQGRPQQPPRRPGIGDILRGGAGIPGF